MKQENKQFLDSNRHHYDTWVKAKFIQHLDGATRERMKNVIREEFFPDYTVSLWCSTCVTEMIVLLYTNYDKYLEKEKNELESKVQDEAFIFPDDLDKIEPEKNWLLKEGEGGISSITMLPMDAIEDFSRKEETGKGIKKKNHKRK